MENEKFFVIENKELLLDKVLVDFNGEPVFFVCQDGENYYISLNVSNKEERYFLARVSLHSLSKMLHQKLTMRELIMQAEYYWDICAGITIGEDVIIKKDMQTIPMDLLPFEGAYLKIATKDMMGYVEKIDSDLYNEGCWEKITSSFAQEYLEKTWEKIDFDIQTIYEKVIKQILVESIEKTLGQQECVDEISNSNMIWVENEKIEVEVTENESILAVAA